MIRKPIAIATSKPARKTYLNTILFLSTSLVLFGFAVVAYAGFYWSWVPALGVERRVWLQFAYVYHSTRGAPVGGISMDAMNKWQQDILTREQTQTRPAPAWHRTPR